METSRIIKKLEDYNQISSDNELDSILNELSKFSFEDFIYIEYTGNSKNLDIRELFRKLVKEIDYKINKKSIKTKIAIIKSLIQIFQKGLNENNLIYFFIFLYANSRITLPIGELVNKYELNEEFHEILIKIFEVLNNIKIQAADKSWTIHFDKINVNKEKALTTSLRQIDFEKNNPLLKNNKFLLPNHFYQMIEVLYDYDLELFEKLLTSDNIFTLVLTIKCMSFNQIESFFIKHKTIKEKTLLCFLMKFLRITSDNKQNYRNMLVNMCIQLYNLNKTLFKELIDIFIYNDFFNELLGLMFCEVSKDDLNILIETIPLSDNTHWISVRNKMLEKCKDWVCPVIHF